MTYPPWFLTPLLGCFQKEKRLLLISSLKLSCFSCTAASHPPVYLHLLYPIPSVLGVLLEPLKPSLIPEEPSHLKASSQRPRAPAPPSATRTVTLHLKPLHFADVSSVLGTAVGGGTQTGADKHQAEGWTLLSPVPWAMSCSPPQAPLALIAAWAHG